MKSLLLLPTLLYLSEATGAWRFVSKVEELPVEITDRLEILRPKVRMCSGDSDSEESTDCVLCTVCHPHEYELIGCSGQMDAVCASCTTGWMRSTPKTTDFFRKCKKHPQLPFLFPDIPYPVRLNVEPSLFAQQEKMLQHAENTETAETDDDLSDEEDYEDDEEDEEWIEKKEEDESKEIGVKPVEVDERDDGFEDSDEFFKDEEQKHIDDSIEIIQKEDVIEISKEEDSMELKEEERADPFASKKDKKKTEEANDDEESEEIHQLYPLHKANIWRIIGPELAAIDDKDIAKEVRNAINDRMEARQMEILRRRLNEESENILEIAKENSANGQRLVSGYRPLLVRSGGSVQYSLIERINRVPLVVSIAWILIFSLSSLVLIVMLKICMSRRRNRVIILPELDDMSRQLINEAHARVHSKKEKKTRPEFV